MCACAVLMGACTGLCEPMPAAPLPGPAQPSPALTSWKHSRSSENSGSLVSTVETISSRVCAEAAQRVCVNLLNSGCSGRKAGCLDPPCRGRLPATRADTHTDSRGGPGARDPGQDSGHRQEVEGVCAPFSKDTQLWPLHRRRGLRRPFPPSPLPSAPK